MKLCRFSLRQVAGLIKKYAPWALLVGLRVMAPVARSCIVCFMGIMHLHILAKLEETVLVVVNS